MSESFDPYYQWLRIPAEEQPVNHYRLLGTRVFEDDADVIRRAAERRMAELGEFQGGPYGPLSQKLLNEVATARVCLLNAEKKLFYDAELRARLETQRDVSEHALRRHTPQRGRSAAGSRQLVWAVVGALFVGLLAGGAAVWLLAK